MTAQYPYSQDQLYSIPGTNIVCSTKTTIKPQKNTTKFALDVNVLNLILNFYFFFVKTQTIRHLLQLDLHESFTFYRFKLQHAISKKTVISFILIFFLNFCLSRKNNNTNLFELIKKYY